MLLFYAQPQVILKSGLDPRTKHVYSKHHVGVHPWYLHENNAQRFLPRASAPSALQECVGNLPNRYIQASNFPRIPNRESLTRTGTDRMMFPSIRATEAAVWTSHLSLLM